MESKNLLRETEDIKKPAEEVRGKEREGEHGQDNHEEKKKLQKTVRP